MIRMGVDSCLWVVILSRTAARSQLRHHATGQRFNDDRDKRGLPQPRRPRDAEERQEEARLELGIAGALEAAANLRAFRDHAEEDVKVGIRQAIDRPPAEGGERDLAPEPRPPSPFVPRRGPPAPAAAA